MALLAALVTLAVASVNYLLHRDVMYPGFLQASLWCAAISLFLLTQGMFVPVSDDVFIFLVAGVVLFSMGSFVASYDHRPHLKRNYLLAGTLPSTRVVSVLALIVGVGLVLYVRRANQIASLGPTSNWFVNLRYNLSVTWEETGGDLGPVTYFLPLAYLLAAIAILRRRGFPEPRGSRLIVALALLMGLVFGVLSSGRSVLLPLIVVVLSIPAILRMTKPARTATTLALFALVVFVAMGVALGKGGSLGSSVGDTWPTMRTSLVTYAVGGIPALSAFLHNRGPDVGLGVSSFRTLFAVLRALGFHVTAEPLVQPYIDVPTPVNVYTVYEPYLKDFGALGGASVLFVLGFLHAMLYRRATVRNPHAIYVFLFAVSLFPLVMQVFQDMYFSVLSLWIQYATYATLLFVILKERRDSSRLDQLAHASI